MNYDGSYDQVSRRAFLGHAGACTTAVALGSMVMGGAAAAPAGGNEGRQSPLLPTVTLGGHEITRLVAGYNPIGGYSHATPITSRQMREWFTPDRTVAFLQECEAKGMNAFQFDLCDKTKEVLPRLYDSGSKMQFICLHAERGKDAPLGELMRYKPIAVVHHGGVTDSLFRAGKAELVHDFVKKVHDAGALAGVSAHRPENIQRIADEGWELDLFMACFQNVSRTPEEMKAELGFVTVGEAFVEEDRDKMAAVIRAVDKPCLAFKILAAGRRCDSTGHVREAFRYAFESIKKADGVIVGMFPIYDDQIGQNARFTREFGSV